VEGGGGGGLVLLRSGLGGSEAITFSGGVIARRICETSKQNTT
jgi:hypothetical protein